MARLPDFDWRRAADWLHRDARDDFFPDPFRYHDIHAHFSAYAAGTQRNKMLQYGQDPHSRLQVPKVNHLHRDAVWLGPQFRLVYLALLAELIPEIAPRSEASCYSYRLKSDRGSVLRYPFNTAETVAAWLRFHNGFRRMLAEGRRWGAVTDLTAFYEHIAVDRLIGCLRSLTTADRSEIVDPCFDILEKALLWASHNGTGIPQNLDPSSFFCSAMLTEIDRHMSSKRGVQYLRYVDDIRIVTKTKGEAVDALGDLQSHLRQAGFFLNSAKTELLEPGSSRWNDVLDAGLDVEVAAIDAALGSSQEAVLRACIPRAIAGLDRSIESGDGRMTRAFGNRLKKLSEFPSLFEQCAPKLVSAGVRQLAVAPESADTWARFVATDSSSVEHELAELLTNPDQNRHQWSNMWVIFALAQAPTLSSTTLGLLRSIAADEKDLMARSWALLAIGRHGDNVDRARIAREYLGNASSPLPVRRAAMIAVQELTASERDRAYGHCARSEPRLQALVDYIQKHDAPHYDWHTHVRRGFSERLDIETAMEASGFGFVGGEPVEFSINADLEDGYG